MAACCLLVAGLMPGCHMQTQSMDALYPYGTCGQTSGNGTFSSKMMASLAAANLRWVQPPTCQAKQTAVFWQLALWAGTGGLGL